MNQLSIGVIIPAYNCEQYIQDALQSIAKQTITPDRVVVVDDGSTDATGHIVDEFAQSSPLPIEVIHQNNGGIAAARNAAVSRCTEDLLAFLDGDDTFYPPFLERAANVLTNHPDIVLCFLDRDVVDSTGHFMRHDLDHPAFREMSMEQRRDGTYVLTGNPFMTLVRGNVIPIGMMMRRSAFKRVGGFDDEQRAVEDMPFLIRLTKMGRFGFINEPLGIWRRHTDNTSGAHRAFEMQCYIDLALTKLQEEAVRWQLTADERAALNRERLLSASRLVYAASNQGHDDFPAVVWQLIRAGRAPWQRLPRGFARYVWRRIRNR